MLVFPACIQTFILLLYANGAIIHKKTRRYLSNIIRVYIRSNKVFLRFCDSFAGGTFFHVFNTEYQKNINAAEV